MDLKTTNQTTPPAADQVVRISLSWIFLGIFSVVLLGLGGGILAQQIFRTPLPPLTNETDRLVTTVQEVTISPNTAVAQLIDRTNRSVFLLGRGTDQNATLLATGVAVTNDGVVLSSVDISGANLLAIDSEGRRLPLERIGRDDLFGVSYYRIPDAVIAPIDLRQLDSAVGQELVALSRNAQTYLPRIRDFRINEFALPTQEAPDALQRVLLGTPIAEELHAGSPLLDDEGRVAGLLQNPDTGIALPVSHLHASLQRLTNNQREFSPFAGLGLTVTYTYAMLPPNQTMTFAAQVASTVPGSAAAAQLNRDDYIIAVRDEPVAADRNMVLQLSGDLPIPLRVVSGGQERTINLQTAATQESPE